MTMTPTPHEENVNLSSLTEAQNFMNQFEWYNGQLEASLIPLKVSVNETDRLDPDRVRIEVVKHWSAIMSNLPLQQQQDRIFQNNLTAALENVILSQLHDRILQELYTKYEQEDTQLWKQCQFLREINLSAERLGIPEGYAISFPAAVVELAALDILKCPLDKLRCLRSTVDYIEAEIKKAGADTDMVESAAACVPAVTTGDIVPLLTAVLIQAKPLHLVTNLHYVESFQQTLSPCDPLSTSLHTFQSALRNVMSINIENEEESKPVRLGRGMSKEIKLEELSELSYYMDKVSKGSESPVPVTPLECQLHNLAQKIEMAMDYNSQNTSSESSLTDSD